MSGLRVPLHALHAGLGARFVPFAGFDMPVLYTSILEEHKAVRTSWGVFDVSHMSNLEVPLTSGDGLARAVAWDVRRLKPGTGKYTVACRTDGTILDDLIVYRLADRFHVVPNAGMNGAVAEHLRTTGASCIDRSRNMCILAVQGPRAPAMGPAAVGLASAPGRFKTADVPGGFASGTGYTGEAGFELFLDNTRAERVMRGLLDAGARPCGLGARDTLRLEKGYALASHEFDPPRTPIEAGLGWVVDADHDFVGAPALRRQRDEGTPEHLVGLECTEPGIPRRDHAVVRSDERVGTVTSGTQSPSLGHGIALAYVRSQQADAGTELHIEVRPGRRVACRVTKLPFL